MKKFFGLKMTLAALAVVSFASCYDSESGDVVIPNSTTIELPAPLYVVNGSISNLETGAAVQEVTISGAVSTSASNGYFEVSSSSPFSGDVTFEADGFYDASRSIAQSTLQNGQGTLVSSLNVAMSPVGYIPNGVDEDVVTPGTPVVAEAETLTTAQVAELISEVAEFTNDGDEPIEAEFSPSDLGIELPYGAVVAAAKSEESMKQLFIDYVGRTWGNDPYDDYIVCTKKLKVVVPAHSVLKGLVSIKLKEEDPLTIGYIVRKGSKMSEYGEAYVKRLMKYKEL